MNRLDKFMLFIGILGLILCIGGCVGTMAERQAQEPVTLEIEELVEGTSLDAMTPEQLNTIYGEGSWARDMFGRTYILADVEGLTFSEYSDSETYELRVALKGATKALDETVPEPETIIEYVEVPVEVIVEKEVIKEVPVYIYRTITEYVEVPVEKEPVEETPTEPEEPVEEPTEYALCSYAVEYMETVEAALNFHLDHLDSDHRWMDGIIEKGMNDGLPLDVCDEYLKRNDHLLIKYRDKAIADFHLVESAVKEANKLGKGDDATVADIIIGMADAQFPEEWIDGSIQPFDDLAWEFADYKKAYFAPVEDEVVPATGDDDETDEAVTPGGTPELDPAEDDESAPGYFQDEDGTKESHDA